MTDREAINALRLEGGLEINGTATRIAEFMMGLHIAISALQEREERARGCKECTEQFVQGKTWVEYVADGKYNFCPMCGRELKTAMTGEEV